MTPNPRTAEVWLFDLDNTLYSHRYNLFEQVARRMTRFIVEQLSLDEEHAKSLQKKYFYEYGTTLNGLMTHHAVEGHDFLDYVHDIDYSVLPANPRLEQLLERIEGRKLIFTNGSRGHARQVTDRLGVSHHFEDCFDIIDADYIPKPHRATCQRLINQHRIDARKAILIEDLALNLREPKALGMQTVLIHTDEDWARPPEDADYIDHHARDLTEWLAEIFPDGGQNP